MELSEEEKKAIEELEDFIEDDEIQNISVFTAKKIKNIIEKRQKEIEKLDYELVREEQYTDFYKDLCDKQQKLINQLLEDMKERANNFSYESEIMWRKIEKAEKLLKET